MGKYNRSLEGMMRAVDLCRLRKKLMKRIGMGKFASYVEDHLEGLSG